MGFGEKIAVGRGVAQVAILPGGSPETRCKPRSLERDVTHRQGRAGAASRKVRQVREADEGRRWGRTREESLAPTSAPSPASSVAGRGGMRKAVVETQSIALPFVLTPKLHQDLPFWTAFLLPSF